MKCALVIIDVQEAFIGHRRDEKAYGETFEYINATAALFSNHEAGLMDLYNNRALISYQVLAYLLK